jgi:hypothetical protein
MANFDWGIWNEISQFRTENQRKNMQKLFGKKFGRHCRMEGPIMNAEVDKQNEQ